MSYPSMPNETRGQKSCTRFESAWNMTRKPTKRSSCEREAVLNYNQGIKWMNRGYHEATLGGAALDFKDSEQFVNTDDAGGGGGGGPARRGGRPGNNGPNIGPGGGGGGGVGGKGGKGGGGGKLPPGFGGGGGGRRPTSTTNYDSDDDDDIMGMNGVDVDRGPPRPTPRRVVEDYPLDGFADDEDGAEEAE